MHFSAITDSNRNPRDFHCADGCLKAMRLQSNDDKLKHLYWRFSFADFGTHVDTQSEEGFIFVFLKEFLVCKLISDALETGGIWDFLQPIFSSALIINNSVHYL